MLTDALTRSKVRLVALVVGVGLAAAGLAACVTPITPSVVYQQSTFEGFPVISYVPQHPRGMIYLFHGSGGSADFATRVDTVDVLNRFVAEGYGFVSTSSTERTGEKRWDAGDPSLTANPDLSRLVRLQAHLVATTPLESTTPLAGIGMSNGSRFVTLWGETWKDAGYPLEVIWASHGKIADPVAASGGLTVPTVFSTSKNDFTVPPFQVALGYHYTAQAGTPALYLFSQERALAATTYPRIPGVDATEANAIVAALKATGVWNAQGVRVVPDIQAAVAQAQSAVLPASIYADGLANEVSSETARLLAAHQFTSEFLPQVDAFFDTHIPA
jgi:hypothetical protein